MHTLKCIIRDGISETFTSTGTLNRILNQSDKPDYQNYSDEEDLMDD